MPEVTLYELKQEISACLCQVGQDVGVKRGYRRQVTVEKIKKPNGPTRHIPLKDMWLGQVSQLANMVWEKQMQISILKHHVINVGDIIF